MEHHLIGIATVIALGIGAQWLAWRVHLPSILVLLVVGFLAGPITGLLHPNELFGELLLPVVSIAVAIILFEGGLSLSLPELREVGSVFTKLVTLGALVTGAASAALAWAIFGIGPSLAALLGAILIVTGPTVIMPLLRDLRPRRRLGNTLKWEGIVIDPVGAILAVLVFEVILAMESPDPATSVAIVGILKAIGGGTGIGLIGAGALVVALRRYWIPDFLQNPVTLMAAVLAYTASNQIQPESGLLAVTLMGAALANQRAVTVKHIVEFKENLRVLLIAVLFILLAARLPLASVTALGPEVLGFIALLILVVRPLAVALCTIGSRLSWRERAFVAWMAPRGIVAAAVSSLFALRLSEAGYSGTEALVAITFAVITGTVAVYGLTAGLLARWLGVADPNPQGALIIGAQPWAREIAQAIRDEGFPVRLVDDNWAHITAARQAGFETFYAGVLQEYVLDEIDLDGIGRLLALTPNDEVNALAALHFMEIFGRAEVYQLPPPRVAEGEPAQQLLPRHLRGRLLFEAGATHSELERRFAEGAMLKRTSLTKEFGYRAFREHYGDSAVPLFAVKRGGRLVVITTDIETAPEAGDTLIALVEPVSEADEMAVEAAAS
ncbi:MAG: cation:proton antiporter, partial [Candidatus Bipolaricaulia bacterium]